MTRLRDRYGLASAPMIAGFATILAVSCGSPPAQQPAAGGPKSSAASPAADTAPRPAADTAASGPVCGGTDPHAKHLNGGLGCAVCHPCGGQFGFTNVYTYPRGTSTAGGSITRVAGSPATCAVACHSPMNGPPHTVTWVPGTLDCTKCHDVGTFSSAHPSVTNSFTRAECEACHTQTSHTSGTVTLVAHAPQWMDQADPGFHAYSANRGLDQCQQCHLQDLSGGVTGVSCAQCHDKNLPPGVASWKTNCVMCHGGTDNQSGAPPRTTWGNSADAIRVGAHTSHLTASTVAAAFDCGVCHVKPVDALSQGHVDQPTATVAFGGLATSGSTPTWDRGTATCSNVYCHGATIGGGTNKTPVWTAVGTGQAKCGTCHGLPPPSPHPEVPSDLKVCNACHSLTIDPGGALIPPASGGKHLDGVVEATGGHSASWMDPNDPGFHAFSANRGLAACTSCHGADLSGGIAGVSCAQCHDANLPPGIPSWQVNCVMCHGGVDNQTGAPPRTTWGNSADLVRVGAHTAHVKGSAIATAFDCSVCHVKPADALSAAHVDGPTATLTWSGLATSGGAAPFWNRPAATCSSTYCHGNYSGTFNYTTYDYDTGEPIPRSFPYKGGNGTPTWTGAAMTCTSCHANPPTAGYWHLPQHYYGIGDCAMCHPDAKGLVIDGGTITNPALHVNGIVDVQPQFVARCYNCH